MPAEPTIGFICPLKSELAAVLAIFDQYHDAERDAKDGVIYHRGSIGRHEVVAVCLPGEDIGPVVAVTHALYLRTRYPSLDPSLEQGRGSLRFLVGIAGGVPGDRTDADSIRLGDVVVASDLVSYSEGKLESGRLLRNARSLRAPETLRYLMNYLQFDESGPSELLTNHIKTMVTNHEERNNDSETSDLWQYPGRERDRLFQSTYEHVRSTDHKKNCDNCDVKQAIIRDARKNDSPYVHYGLVASADFVLKDANYREELLEENPDIAAVEMEASAVAKYDYIVVRGICDYADSHKEKSWQSYAAATAAACAKVLIETIDRLPDDGRREVLRRPVSFEPPSSPGASTSLESGHYPRPMEAPSAGGSTPLGNNEGSEHKLQQHTTHGDSPENVQSLAQKTSSVLWSGSVNKLSIAVFHKVQKDEQETLHLGATHVKLLMCSSEKYYDSHREIQLTDTRSKPIVSETIWLPIADIKVRIDESTVHCRFSNCTNMRQSSEYGSHDGQKQYSSCYSKTPNVDLTFECNDPEAAIQLGRGLLTWEFLHGHEEVFRRTDGGLTVCNISEGYTDPIEPRAIMQSQFEDGYESLSLSYLGPKLDVELNLNQERELRLINFRISELLEIDYRSNGLTSTYWPPEGLERNKEGKPDSYGMQELEVPVEFTVSPENCDTVLSWMTPDWDLVFTALEVSCRYYERSFKKGAFKPAYVTVWKNKASHILRVLARLDQPSDSWLATTPAQDSLISAHGATIAEDRLMSRTRDQQSILTQTSVPICQGSHLDRTTMLPCKITDKSDRRNSKTTTDPTLKTATLNFEFHDSSILIRFEEVLSSCSKSSCDPESSEQVPPQGGRSRASTVNGH